MGRLVTRTSVSPITTFDYYIGPSGNDSNPGTLISPWSITALNTKRATYAGKRVGLMDGTYNVHTAVNSGTDHIPVFNIEGGTSSAPTVIASVNALGAWVNAKSGSTYGGNISYADGTPIIGNALGSVTLGYVVIDGLKISGCYGTPIQLGYSGTINSCVVKNCEIFDCSGVGLGSGGNLAAIVAYNNDGLQVLNNYIHDIVGITAGSSDHANCILTWGSINTTARYNTVVNVGAMFYAKVGTQYNIDVSYNYCDASGYSDGSNCIQDGLSSSPVVSGSYYRVRNNILLAGTNCVAIMRGGTAQECGSENVEVSGNTLIYAGSSTPGDYQGFLAVNKYTSGPSIFNNLCYSTAAAGVNGTGGVWLSAGPATLIDYNIYPTAQARWGVTTNGATFYPTSAATTLTGGSFPWTGTTPVSGSIGKEAHSLQSNTADFLSTGSFADSYKLGASSAALNAGKIGGVVGGATCNIGAWDGIVTKIGYDSGVRI